MCGRAAVQSVRTAMKPLLPRVAISLTAVGLAVASAAHADSGAPRPVAAVVSASTSPMVPAGQATAARSVYDDCAPSQLRLSARMIQNAFTGGAYPEVLTLRNVSRSECSVEGHPRVVVRPHPFPVTVGDLADFDRNNPYIDPERVLHIQPGGRAYAYVVVGRPCDGAKGEMTRGTIRFAFYGTTTSINVPACRHQGVEIDTGPFLPRL